MVVLITGGARGIGDAITKYLLESGNIVYLNYLTSDQEASLIASGYQNQVILIKGDINDLDYVKRLMQKIKEEQGTLDLLINNACYCADDLISNKTKEAFLKELNTNLVAPFMITKDYYETFNKGMIINMLSTDGIDTYNEYNMGYAASKAGLLNLTKSMAYSLKDFKVYGLMLNYVNSPSVNEMMPEFLESELKRINQKELIELDSVINHLDKLIRGNYESGYIERVDCNE